MKDFGYKAILIVWLLSTFIIPATVYFDLNWLAIAEMGVLVVLIIAFLVYEYRKIKELYS